MTWENTSLGFAKDIYIGHKSDTVHGGNSDPTIIGLLMPTVTLMSSEHIHQAGTPPHYYLSVNFPKFPNSIILSLQGKAKGYFMSIMPPLVSRGKKKVTWKRSKKHNHIYLNWVS